MVDAGPAAPPRARLARAGRLTPRSRAGKVIFPPKRPMSEPFGGTKRTAMRVHRGRLGLGMDAPQGRVPGRSLKTEEREPKASAGGSGRTSRGRTSNMQQWQVARDALRSAPIDLPSAGDVESVPAGSLIL